MNLDNLYNQILASHNIVSYIENNTNLINLVIKLYLLSFTNYSVINRDRSLKENETYKDIDVALNNIIAKRIGEKVFDKDILESIVNDFHKKIKYMQSKGHDIELRDTMMAPAIESVKYLPILEK